MLSLCRDFVCAVNPLDALAGLSGPAAPAAPPQATGGPIDLGDLLGGGASMPAASGQLQAAPPASAALDPFGFSMSAAPSQQPGAGAAGVGQAAGSDPFGGLGALGSLSQAQISQSHLSPGPMMGGSRAPMAGASAVKKSPGLPQQNTKQAPDPFADLF